MSAGGEFYVDVEELRAAGGVMLGTGDAVQAVAGAGVLLGRGAYGADKLTDAARRFADRFSYVLNGLSREVVDAGEDLRASAVAYQEVDLDARACLARMQLPGALTDSPLGGSTPGLGRAMPGPVFGNGPDPALFGNQPRPVLFVDATPVVRTPFDEAGA